MPRPEHKELFGDLAVSGAVIGGIAGGYILGPIGAIVGLIVGFVLVETWDRQRSARNS